MDQRIDQSINLSARRLEEAPPGQNEFSKLPDEMIFLVFSYLCRSTVVKCAHVSKRWKRLAYEVLWAKLDLSGSRLEPSILGTVLLRGPRALRIARSVV